MTEKRSGRSPEAATAEKRGPKPSPSESYAFFATCAKGLEELLLAEIEGLGAGPARQTVAGVYFGELAERDSLEGAYRVCLWSRLANKVLLPLKSLPANTADAMYDAAAGIPWEEYLSPNGSLLVDFIGTDRVINNSQFGALKIKDAVVDRLRDRFGSRPSVSKQYPDLRINARLHRGKVALSLDMSGDSLHRRGYRQQQGLAPLKENLAAAILLRAGWPRMVADARTQGTVERLALLDPMCGSGTILIEGALMAADIAPGLARPTFGFESWLNHQSDVWLAIREEALKRRQQGMALAMPQFLGFDQDAKVLRAAKFNAQRAKLERHIQFTLQSVEHLAVQQLKDIDHGLVLSNPPYGERLGEIDTLGELYRGLGDRLKECCEGWQCGVFTGNPELGKTMGLRAHKRYKMFNGPLPSELLLIRVESSQFVNAPPKAIAPKATELQGGVLYRPREESELSDGAVMVLNRLRKNLKSLRKWAKASEIDCYRVYDADIPEYAAAIDVYGEYWHVQEYQAPRSIDEDKAKERFQEMVDAIVSGFQLNDEQISVKQRRRQSGKKQYESHRDRDEERRSKITVNEGRAQLAVNLWDYLDSGVFLDHRLVRKEVAELSYGKRLLNLFCYTGTVTVQAALAGAHSSVSVDMSRTYIDWARENLELNNISESRHALVQEDCFTYLNNCREAFDVIMLDPPSFSNSKRMSKVLDIQQDHVGLIKRCMDLLKPGGVLVFSNNLRSFKLDYEALDKFDIDDFSAASIDKDFQRNAKIHQCWLIQAK
ncbi:bifunctional 23S rRNA (guanine(2069)-N(7))-methyltransferase RlmK/23S rRNA (guanine(2445)-N(2))-methyltransferase RlmL [Pseudoteredinibacter isoporae]|uniref:bifunctional 23S rRNA (guanine(2069)-N(7))-methyltransferase RlmK/23S rRNA (guanine(2445)-N(2))-methyltransferase RlmL n=1 Tax=Pseudoteredinibacter isoporae TaxID=570281 RepID=UPI0031041E6E